jgi:hypothetical protein
MKIKIFLIILQFIISGNLFSQLCISYDFNFLNNSNYNLKKFVENESFRYTGNHHLSFECILNKNENQNFRTGIDFQYLYGETDVLLGSGSNFYELVKKRKINAIGINLGVERVASADFLFGISGVIGLSFISKINDYSPDNSFPTDEIVLSKGPFFSISISSKYRFLKLTKLEGFLKVSIIERLIELEEGNFTIGLGLEFNFLNDIKKD